MFVDDQSIANTRERHVKWMSHIQKSFRDVREGGEPPILGMQIVADKGALETKDGQKRTDMEKLGIVSYLDPEDPMQRVMFLQHMRASVQDRMLQPIRDEDARRLGSVVSFVDRISEVRQLQSESDRDRVHDRSQDRGISR